MANQIKNEPIEAIRVSPSENMNILMGSVLLRLANIHPDKPAHLIKDGADFFTRDRIAKYKHDVIDYYNEHDDRKAINDPEVTKNLIMLHYLDTLLDLTYAKSGFDEIFSTNSATQSPLLAGSFYSRLSREFRNYTIPSSVTPEQFCQYLKGITEQYIPLENRKNKEFDWLEPTGTFLVSEILKEET